MTRAPTTLPPEYFTRLYDQDPDPWQFATSAYERDKYEATLAALPRARFIDGLEIGCANGVLTQKLALRVDRLLAVDAAENAVALARQRCAALGHVTFQTFFVPSTWPAGQFDLIVLSEVVYYLTAEDVDLLAARVRSSLRPGGTILLVHWTGETDYPLSGDDAAALFGTAAESFADVVLTDRQEHYRLDVFIGKTVSAG